MARVNMPTWGKQLESTHDEEKLERLQDLIAEMIAHYIENNKK